VELEANPPTRMTKAVAEGLLGVLVNLQPIHGLQDEGAEIKMLEVSWSEPLLGVDKLQFVAVIYHDGSASLRADADPVDTWRNRNGAVGLESDLEPGLVKSIDERNVELEQGLAPGANRQGAPFIHGPETTNCCRQIGGRLISPTHRPIDANEIGVAPPGASAMSMATIFFTTRPE
jgi:hypothetical protein